jgi:hypothetical protein
MRYILSLCLAIAVPWPAQAELIDLTRPAGPGALIPGSFPYSTSQVVVRVNESVVVNSLGAFLDPTTTEPVGLNAAGYLTDADDTIGPQLPGEGIVFPLLDVGLAWYDVPVNWELQAGQHYFLQIQALGTVQQFSFPAARNGDILFNPPRNLGGPEYDAGPFTVTGFPNGGSVALSQLRVDVSPIPEPSAIVLMMLGFLLVYSGSRFRAVRANEMIGVQLFSQHGFQAASVRVNG